MGSRTTTVSCHTTAMATTLRVSESHHARYDKTTSCDKQCQNILLAHEETLAAQQLVSLKPEQHHRFVCARAHRLSHPKQECSDNQDRKVGPPKEITCERADVEDKTKAAACVTQQERHHQQQRQLL